VFQGIDLTNPGSILTAILTAVQNGLQPIVDAVVGAFTGSSAIGNDVTAIIRGLVNGPLQLINNTLQFFESLFGLLGGQTGGLDARISALEATALGASGLVSGDNFNRATIGSGWTNVSGTLTIAGGAYVKSSALAAAYYNVSSPSTDKHGAAIKLVARWAGDCRFFICSDTTMSNYVTVDVHLGILGDDYIRLMTGSSPSLAVTQKQANYAGFRLLEGDVIALKYDPTTNTYYVTRNSTIINALTWTDSTNIVTHGSTKRNVGVVTNSLNQSAFPGFGITDFVYYDWN
jgi:hypothetical protein